MSEPTPEAASPIECPRCHQPFPPCTPGRLCPRCLLAQVLQPTEPAPDPAEPFSHEELTRHFPHLEILSCLGRGGMGVVYKARQRSLNRVVALKLLAPERALDPEFALRFEKEAHALAALNHPHIVSIYDFGQTGGFYFLLMEFVDGPNLRQLLQTKRLTPEEALRIVPPICDALQCAHDQGIVHRDIKPENLLLDRSGTVKIADFGIAKIVGRPSSPTPAKSGASPGASTPSAPSELSGLAGTPDYASPEQMRLDAVLDHRADIYSLGVVLYELLTGERPNQGFHLPSTRLHTDLRLDEILIKALQYEPELRFATAAEFRQRIEEVASSLHQDPLRLASTGGPRPPWSFLKRHRLGYALTTLAILAGLSPLAKHLPSAPRSNPTQNTAPSAPPLRESAVPYPIPSVLPAIARSSVGSTAPQFDAENWIFGKPVTDWKSAKAHLISFWHSSHEYDVACLRRLDTLCRTFGPRGLVGVAHYQWHKAQAIGTLDRLGPGLAFRASASDPEVIRREYRNGELVDSTRSYEAWLQQFGWKDTDTLGLTFLITQDGKVAWMGSIEQLTEPFLEAVLTDRFDLTHAAGLYVQAQEAGMWPRHAKEEFHRLLALGEWNQALERWNERTGFAPEANREGERLRARFHIALASAQVEHATELLSKLQRIGYCTCEDFLDLAIQPNLPKESADFIARYAQTLFTEAGRNTLVKNNARIADASRIDFANVPKPGEVAPKKLRAYQNYCEWFAHKLLARAALSQGQIKEALEHQNHLLGKPEEQVALHWMTLGFIPDPESDATDFQQGLRKARRSRAPDPDGLRGGQIAPSFPSAHWIQGKPLEQWEEDHLYLVYFWNSSNSQAPKDDFPKLQQLAQQFKPMDLEIVIVNVAEPQEAKARYLLKAFENSQTVRIALDPTNTLKKLWRPRRGWDAGLPLCYVIDGSGKIVALDDTHGGNRSCLFESSMHYLTTGFELGSK
jgi:serine/threonine protein kinase